MYVFNGKLATVRDLYGQGYY